VGTTPPCPGTSVHEGAPAEFAATSLRKKNKKKIFPRLFITFSASIIANPLY